jgi:polysaccharide export outer membrane protein
MAPGLYIDNLDVPEHKESTTERLGGEVKIIPITAKLAARHKMESENRLQGRRMRAHQLYLKSQFAKERFEYRIGPYDILNITVWGHPELNVLATSNRPGLAPQPIAGITDTMQAAAVATGHRVDSKGNIFFPHVGTVHVARLTISEVRDLLIKKLTTFIPEPQLDVGVGAYRSQRVYVLGEVKNPKAIAITDAPLKLIDAVTRTGGFTKATDTRNVFLIREGQTYHIDLEAIYENGDLTQNYILKHGDVLQFPDNRLNQVYALGEFNKNVALSLPPHFFSVADVIEHPSVGGLNLTSADPSKIFIFRYKDVDHKNGIKTFKTIPEVYHLDASSAEAMLLATNFPLQARDVVYAAPTGLTRWSRVIAQVLPTLQAIWYPVRTAADLDSVVDDDTFR